MLSNKFSVVTSTSDKQEMKNMPYHLLPSYNNSHFLFQSQNPQGGELVENIIKQETNSSNVNDGDYLLEKTMNPSTLSTLNSVNDITVL